MTKEERVDFQILDVGCGTKPKGDVNIDFFGGGLNPQTGDQVQGEFMSREKIENFVMADAAHLPFKDESFNVVFSSHTIEHVQDPLLMLREMYRVAKRKVIVRFPHRKGSGAIMPYHINYLDENWFKQASDHLGFKGTHFAATYEGLITPKLKKTCLSTLQSTLPWRALGRFERSRLGQKFKVPFEVEVWLKKRCTLADSSAKMKFVVVYNRPEIFRSRFSSSPYVSPDTVIAYHNTHKEPLPKFFNKVIQKHLQENIWFVFCHQDFILKEDLGPRLHGKDVETIYGPIGTRAGQAKFSGMIVQTDGTPIGVRLKETAPVQTLDEMCLIAHTEVFRQGLSFDERFRLHFYGADLCMQAYTSGLDVMAMQLKCQHKSTTIYGDLTSSGYLSTLNTFSEKWKKFSPIKTTTT